MALSIYEQKHATPRHATFLPFPSLGRGSPCPVSSTARRSCLLTTVSLGRGVWVLPVLLLSSVIGVLIMATQQAATEATKSLANDVLEEDDEFEEFDLQDWKREETDNGKVAKQFKDDWDDDDGADDNFVKHLRAELSK